MVAIRKVLGRVRSVSGERRSVRDEGDEARVGWLAAALIYTDFSFIGTSLCLLSLTKARLIHP